MKKISMQSKVGKVGGKVGKVGEIKVGDKSGGDKRGR